MPRSGKPRSDRKDRITNIVIRAILWVALSVPYRHRVPMMGWIVSRIVAPLAGWRGRIRDNLAHVCPTMDEAGIRRLLREVPDNAGRTLIEIYSGRDFTNRLVDTPLTGPGLAALEAARDGGKPVILVTGHFGNYDAPRAALSARGFPLAALYREMRNPHFNAHYVEAMETIAKPAFPATRRGLMGFVGHLRSGGTVGILIDVYAGEGADVTFFGKLAPTATSVAEWALKYEAEVIPIYGVRQDDGLSFRIVLDEPVPLTDPVRITQDLNDSLERMTRAHMEQWFWIHRRWKPGTPRPRAARP